MNIVVDTSVIIAVIANEPVKSSLVALTNDATLIAPLSLHWEIGNAFSAMFKRNVITLEEAERAVFLYEQIPIAFKDVSLLESLQLAHELGIYAYDAFMLSCGMRYKAPLLTLDSGLKIAAETKGIVCLEAKK